MRYRLNHTDLPHCPQSKLLFFKIRKLFQPDQIDPGITQINGLFTIKLEPGVHYELDEKERSVYLTDEGLAVVEQETGIENIYDEANYRYVHYMQQALKAQPAAAS